MTTTKPVTADRNAAGHPRGQGYGSLVDRFETSVPIAGGRQIDDIFRARGLGDGPKAALIRVSPYRGLVGAFATLIDGGTGDPTFYGAALAAK